MSVPSSARTATPATRIDPRWPLGLALALALVILLAGQALTPPATIREVRIFKIVDAMLESGDYLLPRLEGKLKLNKPPLYYWAAAGAAKITGAGERIAYRVPSALSAIGLVLFVYGFCVRTGLRELALPAALSLLGMATFYVNARIANFDMLLALFAFSAAACLAAWVREERRGALVLAGIAMALALLAKGTPAFAQVLIPALVMMWVAGKWRSLRRPGFWLGAVILPCIPIAAWGLAALLANEQPTQSFRDALLMPFGAKVETKTAMHHHNPFYFAYNLPLIAFPAALLLPVVAHRAIATRGYADAPVLRWALFSFLAVLLLFSVIPQKQLAYLLPLLPYLALLTADALRNGWQGTWMARWAWIAGGLFVLVLLALTVAAPVHFTLLAPSLSLAAASGLLFLASAAWLARCVARRERGRAAAVALAGWMLALLLHAGSFNVLDTRFKTGEIYQAPDYDAERWNAVFAKHPKLKSVLNTRKAEKDSGDEADSN